MAINLSDKDRDLLIRITKAEAGNQGPMGQAAVAHVIRNRMLDGSFGGHTAEGVVYARNQFEPTATAAGQANMRNVSQEQYAQIGSIIDGVFTDQIADPTGGATHFANVDTVRDRRGGGVTDWMRDMWDSKTDIGDHSFFGGDSAQAQQAQATLRAEGFDSILNKWQSVLNSSPEHVMKELQGLGENAQAQALIEKLQASPGDAKALKEAVAFVQDQAKEVLQGNGIELSSRNLTLAEMFGGNTASELIKNPTAKVGDIVKDEKLLAAAASALGKSESDVSGMTSEDFLGAVDAQQRADKEAMASRVSGRLSEGNQNILNGLLNGDMGMMEFIFMLVLLMMGNAMGLDMSPFFGGMTQEGRAGGGSSLTGGSSGSGRSGGGSAPSGAGFDKSQYAEYLADHAGETVTHISPVAAMTEVTGEAGEDRTTHVHAGVDLAPVVKGTKPEVLASAQGIVVYAGEMNGYGNIAIVLHPDGSTTRYGHLDSFVAREGQSVAQGEVIARMGNTGRSTGIHLHYEQRDANDDVVSPQLVNVASLHEGATVMPGSQSLIASGSQGLEVSSAEIASPGWTPKGQGSTGARVGTAPAL